MFIDYKDQIERKGINNYQRGRHGIYFFVIMSQAKTLIGKNYYEQNYHLLDKTTVKRDLLFRIEEYFYRIQKNYINGTTVDLEYNEKYLSRILLDLSLFTGKIKFEEVHKIYYKDIPNLFIERQTEISDNLLNSLNRFNKSKSISEVPKLLLYLYEFYLECFESYNKKYEKNKI